MFIFTLVYIVGGVLSYKWMDETYPTPKTNDKLPYIIWSLLWPIVWTLEVNNNIKTK